MSSDVRADPITRSIIVLNSGERLHAVDSYQDVYDRIIAARETAMRVSEGVMDNPLSLPLVNVRVVVRLEPGDDAPTGVVDACFNPMYLVAIYRSHPDV